MLRHFEGKSRRGVGPEVLAVVADHDDHQVSRLESFVVGSGAQHQGDDHWSRRRHHKGKSRAEAFSGRRECFGKGRTVARRGRRRTLPLHSPLAAKPERVRLAMLATTSLEENLRAETTASENLNDQPRRPNARVKPRGG